MACDARLRYLAHTALPNGRARSAPRRSESSVMLLGECSLLACAARPQGLRSAPLFDALKCPSDGRQRVASSVSRHSARSRLFRACPGLVACRRGHVLAFDIDRDSGKHGQRHTGLAAPSRSRAISKARTCPSRHATRPGHALNSLERAECLETLDATR